MSYVLWRPEPRVYFNIYQIDPVYERIPYFAPGTQDGERLAVRYTESLAEVAFAFYRKAAYVLVKVSEFDVNGHVAYRHEAILTSWSEPVPEPAPDYPQVPLDELRHTLESQPDDTEDDIDTLLESLVDWDGFKPNVATA